MVELHQLNCVPCRSGEPPLFETEIYRLQQQIPEWRVKEVERVKRLERVFRFNKFSRAREFMDKIAELAEKENHHAVISVEYGTVTLTLWTHKVRGLHKNDFIMAAKIDKLYLSD
jgi:4a-hydroxytetrahydrobiopterin dehydratase